MNIYRYFNKTYWQFLIGWLIGGILVGCQPSQPAEGPSPGSWRLASIRSVAGSPIPGVALDLDGDAGFARATVVVERLDPGTAGSQALYDMLFPIGLEARLIASVVPAADQPETGRVTIRAETGSSSSTSFVEPNVPFLSPSARVDLEILNQPDQQIAASTEITLARWVVQSGPATIKVTFRILLSRQPTGPRLKPDAKPAG